MPEYTLYDSKGKPVRIDGRTWRGHPPQEVYLDAKRGYQRVYYDPASSKGIKDNLIAEADPYHRQSTCTIQMVDRTVQGRLHPMHKKRARDDEPSPI